MKDDLGLEVYLAILSLNFSPEDVSEHGPEIMAQIYYESTINNVIWIPDDCPWL